MEHLKQTGYAIRCEWGLHGLNALRDVSDVIIIVDVLSFTTCVDVALSRQAMVFPFAGDESDAMALAQQHDAILASKRPTTDNTPQFTLSPSSLQHLPLHAKVVLPSPNGSTLSTAAGNTLTLAGCIRNARAVAEYAQAHGQVISVIPAGERFVYNPTDSALRPALEDWIGAGAIIAHLSGSCSPEAQTAKHVYEAYKDQLLATLQTCSSGMELIQKGYAADVELASQSNVSSLVPVLKNQVYQLVK